MKLIAKKTKPNNQISELCCISKCATRNQQIAFLYRNFETFFNKEIKISTKSAQNWLKIGILIVHDAHTKLTTGIFDILNFGYFMRT